MLPERFTKISQGETPNKINAKKVVALDISGSMRHREHCSCYCVQCRGHSPVTLCALGNLSKKSSETCFFVFGPTTSDETPLNLTQILKYNNENEYKFSTSAIAFDGILKFIAKQVQPCSFIFIGDGAFDNQHELKPYLEKADFKNIMAVTLIFPKGSENDVMDILKNDVGDVLSYVANKEGRAIPLTSHILDDSTKLEDLISSNSNCASYHVPENHFDAFGLCTFEKTMVASELAEELNNEMDIATQLRDKHLTILENNPLLALTERLYSLLHKTLAMVFGQFFLDRVSQIKGKSTGQNAEALATLLRNIKLDPEEYNSVVNPLKSKAIGKFVLTIDTPIEELIDAQKSWQMYKIEGIIKKIVDAKPYFTEKVDVPGMYIVEGGGKLNLHALQTMFSQKGTILVEGPPLLFIVCYFLTCGIELEKCVVDMFLNFISNDNFLKQIGFTGKNMEIPSIVFIPPLAVVIMKTLHMYETQIFSGNQEVKSIVMEALKPIHSVIATHFAFTNSMQNTKPITKIFPKHPELIGCIALVAPYFEDPQPNLPSIVVTLSENTMGAFNCIYLDRNNLNGICGKDTFNIYSENLTFLSKSFFVGYMNYIDVLQIPCINDVHRRLNKMYHDGKDGKLGNEMRFGACRNNELLEKNIKIITDLIPIDCKHPKPVDTEVSISIPKNIMAKIVADNLGLPNMESIFNAYAVKMRTDIESALVIGPKINTAMSFNYVFSKISYEITVTPELIKEIMNEYIKIRLEIEHGCPCISKITDFECMICYTDCSKNEIRYGCGHFLCESCHGTYQEAPVKGKLFKFATWSCPYCRHISISDKAPTNIKGFFNKYPSGTPHGHAARCCEKCEIIFTSQISCGNDPENIPVRCDSCTPLEGAFYCPECNLPYVRSDGCDHITCPNPHCGIHFCHLCQYKIQGIEHITDRKMFKWLERYFWKCGGNCDDDYLMKKYDYDSDPDSDSDSDPDSSY